MGSWEHQTNLICSYNFHWLGRFLLAPPNYWLRGTRTSREEEVIAYFSLIFLACYLHIFRLPSNIMIQKIFAIMEFGGACPLKADSIKQEYSLWCQVLCWSNSPFFLTHSHWGKMVLQLFFWALLLPVPPVCYFDPCPCCCCFWVPIIFFDILFQSFSLVIIFYFKILINICFMR